MPRGENPNRVGMTSSGPMLSSRSWRSWSVATGNGRRTSSEVAATSRMSGTGIGTVADYPQAGIVRRGILNRQRYVCSGTPAVPTAAPISVADGDSTIAIDAEGGGDFAAADARIVVEGVDLLGGGADQAAAIDSLVANGNVQAQQAAA